MTMMSPRSEPHGKPFPSPFLSVTRGSGHPASRSRFVAAAEPHAERGARARLAGDLDRAAVLFDDGFGDREAEAGMFLAGGTGFFNAVEPLEDMREILGSDA